MNDKDKYKIKLIINKILTLNGNEAQSQINLIQKYAYESQNIKFESPSVNYKDFKNDGYIPNENRYFQIYSPISLTKNNVLKKIKEDLSGLINHLYSDKKPLWTGKLEKFIFLINAKHAEIPLYENNDIGNFVNKIQKDKNISFEYDIVSTPIYLAEILMNTDSEKMDLILLHLDMASEFNLEPNWIRTIITKILNACVSGDYFQTKSNDCKGFIKVDIDTKIKINKLFKLRNNISKSLKNLYIIDDTVKEINQYVDKEYSFNCFRNELIEIWNKNKTEMAGKDIYELLVNYIYEKVAIVDAYENYQDESYKKFSELLVVYLFNNCDIFFKTEGEYNDTSK
ncbi:hypothetical protein [Mycoplasmopsis primatum]|uniref:hypothetical protein n=1 Tax=Mycoplasmopsis primatum TaxID=55604 RepID=UPI0004966918|nr:hypothetical protein [Mycoplasmopsis primatum]